MDEHAGPYPGSRWCRTNRSVCLQPQACARAGCWVELEEAAEVAWSIPPHPGPLPRGGEQQSAIVNPKSAIQQRGVDDRSA